VLDTDYIRRRRKSLKLSQEQAARAAKLGSRTHWNRIETGARSNIKLATLGRIAKVLGCDVAELLAKPANLVGATRGRGKPKRQSTKR
jgi:transcriptional regulator with XRE-family HTH domain